VYKSLYVHGESLVFLLETFESYHAPLSNTLIHLILKRFFTSSAVDCKKLCVDPPGHFPVGEKPHFHYNILMIIIDLLKNHSDAIPRLAQLSYELIGKIWVSGASVDRVIERFKLHLNDESLPLSFVALDRDKPVGMCSLRANDGIRDDLTPWLGSLVVDPDYQGQGIAQKLMEAVKFKAQTLHFNKCFLFAFDPKIPDYYARHGWVKIGMDEFMGKPVTVMEVKL
jgi:predicted N-acetyltransferase YhbS